MANAFPQKTFSFEWSEAAGFAFQAGLQYGIIYANLKYLDGPGRNAMLANMKQTYGVSGDKRANAQMSEIMGRLSAAVQKEYPDLSEKPYNFFVNNEKTFNAFCTLGHNISVNIGLFNALDYQEDEIAFVLAHEISHGQNNDPINNNLKRSSITMLAGYLANNSGNALDILAMSVLDNAAGAKLVTLPAEKRADRNAFRHSTAAGFNPGGGAALWQRVMDQMDSKSGRFLSAIFGDHPANQARRDLYAQDLSEYSGGRVSADPATGGIYINGIYVFTPREHSGRSGLERAYLSAGAVAAKFRSSGGKIPPAEYKCGIVYLGDTPIYSVSGREDGSRIAAAVNAAANAEK
ncbi:MAG: M48 family metallopeptidase [Elusimicrobiales bacterium]|nr:M48 family metallopeptidase [Elusimicrobiales bacterium]